MNERRGADDRTSKWLHFDTALTIPLNCLVYKIYGATYIPTPFNNLNIRRTDNPRMLGRHWFVHVDTCVSRCVMCVSCMRVLCTCACVRARMCVVCIYTSVNVCKCVFHVRIRSFRFRNFFFFLDVAWDEHPVYVIDKFALGETASTVPSVLPEDH